MWDSHGTGVNLLYDQLDSRCTILMGAGHRGRFVGLDETYDAVLFVGYHARENTANAVLAHTFSSQAFQYYKLNGAEAGELMVDGAYAGERGVPVLFCSSDEAGVQEAKTLFGEIGTVATKKALSWTSAVSRHPDAVCQDIYQQVQAALKRLPELRPFVLEKPLAVEIRYKRMEDAARAALWDQEGKPFERPDPFTRSGVLQQITDLF